MQDKGLGGKVVNEGTLEWSIIAVTGVGEAGTGELIRLNVP